MWNFAIYFPKKMQYFFVTTKKNAQQGCKLVDVADSVAYEREAYQGTSSEETPIEKNIMAGESCDFQPLFNENVVRAVTSQDINRFFRLHLNYSSPVN